MPKNVPPELEEKFKSCKEKVIASGQSEDAAYGICYMSVVEGKSLSDAYKSFYMDTPSYKAGRAISKANAEIIKGIISLARQLVPEEEPEQEEPEEKEPEVETPEGADIPLDNEMKTAGDMLVAYGGAVKSINGKVGGAAVRFGGADLTGDVFDPDANYGFAGQAVKKVDIMFHHGQAIETKSGKRVQVKAPIGEATLRLTDDAILVEDAILFNAEQYAKHLDKLGWSTGAAAHTVVRDGGHIKQWQIAEVSLTPIPAEPRNMVAAKSLDGIKADLDDVEIDYRSIGQQVGKAIAQRLQQHRQPAG